MEVFLAYLPHCRGFVITRSTLWKFCWHTFHIVEVFLTNFPHCRSFVSILSTLWKFCQHTYYTFDFVDNITQCFSHFGGYHCLPSIFTIHVIDHLGYFFNIFNLSLQIYGDFHKSFRNLTKFFREHARGARAIFHLCSKFLNREVLHYSFKDYLYRNIHLIQYPI